MSSVNPFFSKLISATGSRWTLPSTSEPTAKPTISLCAIELEPRVLYSATPIEPAGPIDLLDAADVESFESAFLSQSDDHSLWSFADSTSEVAERGDFDRTPLLSASDEASEPSIPSRQLVFIDTNVENWQALVDELSRSADGKSKISLHVLDAQRDGVRQVSEVLASQQDVAAIHLVSHSNGQQLNLGLTTLTNHNVNDYSSEIVRWQASLAEGADLLLYGCDLASSESGRQLIEELGGLCQCDVAASVDATGQASRGGDWELEYRIGDVETELVIGAELQRQWTGSLATFTVTTTADDFSVGTLRWAIGQANANGGLDTINFNIPDSDLGHRYYRDDGLAGSLSTVAVTALNDGAILDFDPDYPYAAHSWFQIDLDDSLPQLSVTDAIIIDGYSQPGALENTLAIGNDAILRIELTNSASDSNRGLTFDTGSNSSIVRGLAINEFGGLGVLVNYDVHDVTIQGNFIGTDITGTLDRGNGDAAIQIRSDGNLIGGCSVGDRNILSGSNNRGIAFFTTGSLIGNVVENNYIGVDATGINGLGNNSYGIQLYDTDGVQILNNVISDNASDGIRFLAGSNVDNSIIQGNFIGVGADGTTLVGNGGDGIGVVSGTATDNQIGGVGAGNIIAGNDGSGILLDGASVKGTAIIGNSIGTDASGGLNLGNGEYGVLVENGSFGNAIGGILAGFGNTIAFNQRDGVRLAEDAGNSNAIHRNSIFGNAELGIDIDINGVSSNDDLDSDNGANTRINFPVLTSANTDGASNVSISGWFNTTPGVATYRLEFFTSPVADPSGNGEGQLFIGAIDVTTDANGIALFSESFSALVSIGDVVSATATDSLQNTSEFSVAVAAGANSLTTNGFLISTKNDVAGSSAPGLDAWAEGEILSFGGPALELEPLTTVGSFSSAINWDLLGDGEVGIDAIHYVSADTIVGTGAGSIGLLAGDLLISTTNNEVLLGGTMAVDQADLLLYRPIASGEYSIGKLEMVLDLDSPALSDPELSFSNMLSVTLVETDVSVGGYDLFAGEILFTRNGGSNDNDIFVFHVAETGLGATIGAADKLIEGSSLGFSQRINGLDLVESSVAIGDETLNQGTVLISLDSNTDILDGDADPTNDLSVTRNDIVALDISGTEMTGGTVAITAQLVFEGADVNLETADENIDAFAIANSAPALGGNTPPTTTGIPNLTVDEDSVDQSLDLYSAFADAEDLDSELTYTIEANSNPGLFDSVMIGATDRIALDFAEHQNGFAFITVRATDTGGLFAESTFRVDVNPVNDAPFVDVAIAPIVVNESSVDTVIDLSTVFDDVDILTNGDLLTHALVSNSNSSLVTATLGGTVLTLDYSNHQFGSASIVVRATDALGGFVDETISVTVVPVAPSIVNNALLIFEGDATTLSLANLSATDNGIASPSLIFSVSNVLGGQFELASMPGMHIHSFTQSQIAAGEIVFVDDGNEDAPSYDVSVSDGRFNIGPQSAAITFINVNDAPTGNDDVFSIASGEAISGSGLLDNDFDPDDVFLTTRLQAAPSKGTVTVNPDGSFIYLPGALFDGSDSFTYIVNDGTANSAPVTVVVKVVPLPPPTTAPVNPNPADSDTEEDENDDLIKASVSRVATSMEQQDGIVKSKAASLNFGMNPVGGFSLPGRSTTAPVLSENPDLYWLGSSSTENPDEEDSRLVEAMTSVDASMLDRSGWFWQALDQNRRQLEAEASLPQFLLGSTAAIASSVTVSYLIWLIKGGQVLAAVMANLPAWRLIDPLPILNSIIDDDDGDDDSLQKMINEGEDELNVDADSRLDLPSTI